MEAAVKEEPGTGSSSSLLESMLTGDQQQNFTVKTESGASNELKMPSWAFTTGTVKRGANGRPVRPDLISSGTISVSGVRKNVTGVKLKHPTPNFARAVATNGIRGFKKVEQDQLASPPSAGSGPEGCAGDQCNNDAGSVSELEVEETWPGKVCAFCNLGERSQLGQGEMLRLEVGADFETLRQNHSVERSQVVACVASVNSSVVKQPGLIKKPRLTGKGRRSSSFDASNSCLSELQLELNMVLGHTFLFNQVIVII